MSETVFTSSVLQYGPPQTKLIKKLQQLTRSADTGLFLEAVKTSSINGEGLLTELPVTFSEPVLE